MVKKVAIACQGGGSHTAFTAGALQKILEEKDKKFEITALSGTSGGAVCALLVWYGLVRNKIEMNDEDEGKNEAIKRLNCFWNRVAATLPWDKFMNYSAMEIYRSPVSFKISPHDSLNSQTVQNIFRSNLKACVDFDKIKEYFEQYKQGKLKSYAIPELFIGATDVHSGDSKVFRSTEEAITVDMILASAAEPNFLRAIDIDGTTYWDGLFSRNPPISVILKAKEAREKPDEMWIIQIDPRECRFDPKSFIAIEDRRNELAGNLSLEYEVHFIKTLNHLMGKHDSIKSAGKYREIKLRQIGISAYHKDQNNKNLDYASKWNLFPEFLDDLKDYGGRKAKKKILAKFRN